MGGPTFLLELGAFRVLAALEAQISRTMYDKRLVILGEGDTYEQGS